MKWSMRALVNPNSRISGRAYLGWGVALFAFKHVLDRLVAWYAFDHAWPLSSYLLPGRTVGLFLLQEQEIEFYATMLILAVPFIAAGVLLTLRRLQTVGLPCGLVVLFFVPVVNLLLFLLLSVLKSKPQSIEPPSAPTDDAAEGDPSSPVHQADDGTTLDYAQPDTPPLEGLLARLVPDHRVGNVVAAVMLPLPFAVGATLLGVLVFRNYGWGVFVGLPFAQSLVSALLFGLHRPRRFGESACVAFLAVLTWGFVLLLMAFEGLICLIMASPLVLGMSLLGSYVGWVIQFHALRPSNVSKTITASLVFVPLWMGLEATLNRPAPVFEVRTSLLIAAPPESVWPQVIEFSEMGPPTDWLFHTGVAYPTHARISGSGVGAVRYCEFSTGAFVEPIEAWDEPRLLKFSVTASPRPMDEWSPYSKIEPPHAHGFFVARQGQFLLLEQPDGGTLLEGTTWYQHHMWPAAYWQLWSDFVIHRIHTRVLKHIKANSQTYASNGSALAELPQNEQDH